MQHKKLWLLTFGVLGLGYWLLKKIGFFEDDSHLYDEYEAK